MMSVITMILAAFFAILASGAPVPQDNGPTFPPSCDATCQAAYNQGLVYDASLWVNTNVNSDPFYATPDNFKDYAPGDLVKWENIAVQALSANWTIPSGLSLSRFFYVSEDIDGTPLPATGYVLVPYQNPHGADQPLPVVVWAHGTAGFTPQCAPSNNKGLQYHWQAPFALAQEGYVVIAPDYAGLGSKIPKDFMYNAGIPHAADVSTAVKAVRVHFQDTITKEWVVVGHSEGGLTAWRTAEREADAKKAAGSFLGAVAIAPAMDVMKLVPWVVDKAHGGPLGEIFLPFMLQSVGRLFPSIDLKKYVTQTVLELSQLSYGGCLNVAVPLLANLTVDQMYYNKANFPSAPEVQEWEEKYHGKGAHKLGGPLFALHGEGDFIVPPSNTDRVFTEQCNGFPDSTAEYMLLPGLDHDGVVMGSHSNYFPWIADRFNKKPLDRGCKTTMALPANDRFTTTEQIWISGGQMLVQ